MFHNYHATPEGWEWPVKAEPSGIIFDGFSPNLNKELHVGHLKNLCIAAAIANITNAKPVAMLGAANGIVEGALEKYEQWCQTAGYKPDVFFDNQLPAPTVALTDGEGAYAGCKMLGDVVIYKSSGAATYAAHDLSFVEAVKPDFYLTGQEQHSHFKSLGLGKQHLSMGLVLGMDKKKMRSTVKLEGEQVNLMLADELINETLAVLKPTPEPYKLAWNVLAWQFNSTSVGKDTVCDVKAWCGITSPGIYISHTNAKVSKALSFAGLPDAKAMSQEDAELCGYASYMHYYWQKAIDYKEPSHIAQFALTLAKKLSEVYGKKSIKNGDEGFVFALSYAVGVLQQCMKLLGMHVLEEV
jgi:arginyl-tRNA synthetase